jgi:hypothetical protein
LSGAVAREIIKKLRQGNPSASSIKVQGAIIEKQSMGNKRRSNVEELDLAIWSVEKVTFP